MIDNYQVIRIVSNSVNTVTILVEKNKKKYILKHPKNKASLEMLKNEVEILQKINKLSFVPKIVYSGFSDSKNYIVQDCFDMITLDKYEFDSNYDILSFFVNLLDCIAELHTLGIVHADLKPQNILINDNHEIKIIDFGLSFIEGEKSIANFVSYNYSSVEQLKKEKLNCQTDIYSLGIILYKLLFKKLPFNGKLNEIIYKKEKNAFEQVDDELLNIIFYRAFCVDLDRRYKDINEFRQDVLLLFNYNLNYKEN